MALQRKLKHPEGLPSSSPPADVRSTLNMAQIMEPGGRERIEYGRLGEDGRVLAIQRCGDGRWVPPGGVLELTETPSQGVAREVLEETGIKVQAEQLTGVYKNMLRGIVTRPFRCSVYRRTHSSDRRSQKGCLAHR